MARTARTLERILVSYQTPAISDIFLVTGDERSRQIEDSDRKRRPLRGLVVGQQSVGHVEDSIRVVTAKIKSRTHIRQADKIELKMAIGFRRKSLLLNILIIKNIYRFSRES
jgi:hypothetical protein